MEPFLEKIKKEIEKGAIKKYGTFVLIFVTAILFVNVITVNYFGDSLGYSIEEDKTCEEIKGICSAEPCVKGYTELENSCPNEEYCCKKKA